MRLIIFFGSLFLSASLAAMDPTTKRALVLNEQQAKYLSDSRNIYLDKLQELAQKKRTLALSWREMIALLQTMRAIVVCNGKNASNLSLAITEAISKEFRPKGASKEYWQNYCNTMKESVMYFSSRSDKSGSFWPSQYLYNFEDELWLSSWNAQDDYGWLHGKNVAHIFPFRYGFKAQKHAKDKTMKACEKALSNGYSAEALGATVFIIGECEILRYFSKKMKKIFKYTYQLVFESACTYETNPFSDLTTWQICKRNCLENELSFTLSLTPFFNIFDEQLHMKPMLIILGNIDRGSNLSQLPRELVRLIIIIGRYSSPPEEATKKKTLFSGYSVLR